MDRISYSKAACAHLLFSRHSLWLAEDHLLSVRNLWFFEEYTRYYYRDIQALELRRQARLWCPLWVLPVQFVLAVLAMFFSGAMRPAIAWSCLAIFLAICGIVLYRSLKLGCICYVQTAIGTDVISALRQIGRTRKAIAKIVERVHAVQGVLPEDWREALSRQASINPSAEPVAGGLSVSASPANLLHVRAGTVAAVLALAGTLVDGAITFAQARMIAVPMWIGMTNLLVTIVCSVAAIVMLTSTRRLHWLRNISLSAALFAGFLSYLAIVFGNVERSAAPQVRAGVETIRNAVGIVNVVGDFSLVVVAVLLWLRAGYKVRPSQPAAPALDNF